MNIMFIYKLHNLINKYIFTKVFKEINGKKKFYLIYFLYFCNIITFFELIIIMSRLSVFFFFFYVTQFFYPGYNISKVLFTCIK